MRTAIFLAVVYFSASSPASASSWTQVGQSDSFASYIDAESIRKSGKFIDAWSWREYTKRQDGGHRSIATLDRFDCDSRTISLMSFTLYSGPKRTGEVLVSKSYETAVFESVVPDSIGDAKLEFVCARAPTN